MQQKEQQRGDIIFCFGRVNSVYCGGGDGGIPISERLLWKANTAPMCFNFKQHLQVFLIEEAWVKGSVFKFKVKIQITIPIPKKVGALFKTLIKQNVIVS